MSAPTKPAQSAQEFPTPSSSLLWEEEEEEEEEEWLTAVITLGQYPQINLVFQAAHGPSKHQKEAFPQLPKISTKYVLHLSPAHYKPTIFFGLRH